MLEILCWALYFLGMLPIGFLLLFESNAPCTTIDRIRNFFVMAAWPAVIAGTVIYFTWTILRED